MYFVYVLNWLAWLKLGFMYWLFLLFGNANEVMQNPIQKFRQSSIVFKKQGILFEKSKNFDEVQLP